MLDAPRIRDTHAYRLVLVLIVILFIFSDVSSSAPWTATVIILLVALLVSSFGRARDAK